MSLNSFSLTGEITKVHPIEKPGQPPLVFLKLKTDKYTFDLKFFGDLAKKFLSEYQQHPQGAFQGSLSMSKNARTESWEINLWPNKWELFGVAQMVSFESMNTSQKIEHIQQTFLPDKKQDSPLTKENRDAGIDWTDEIPF